MPHAKKIPRLEQQRLLTLKWQLVKSENVTQRAGPSRCFISAASSVSAHPKDRVSQHAGGVYQDFWDSQTRHTCGIWFLYYQQEIWNCPLVVRFLHGGFSSPSFLPLAWVLGWVVLLSKAHRCRSIHTADQLHHLPALVSPATLHRFFKNVCSCQSCLLPLSGPGPFLSTTSLIYSVCPSPNWIIPGLFPQWIVFPLWFFRSCNFTFCYVLPAARPVLLTQTKHHVMYLVV